MDYRPIVHSYIVRAKERDWKELEFAWQEEAEKNMSVRNHILNHLRAKYPEWKTSDHNWGFRMERA